MLAINLDNLDVEDFNPSKHDVKSSIEIFFQRKNWNQININTLSKNIRIIVWFLLYLDKKIWIDDSNNQDELLKNIVLKLKKSQNLGYIWLWVVIEDKLFELLDNDSIYKIILKLFNQSHQLSQEFLQNLSQWSVYEYNINFDDKFLFENIKKIIEKTCESINTQTAQIWYYYVERVINYLLNNNLNQHQIINFFDILKKKILIKINDEIINNFQLYWGKEFEKILKIQDNINFYLQKKMEIVYEYFSNEREEWESSQKDTLLENQELQAQIRQRIDAIDNAAILIEVDKHWFILNMNNKLVQATGHDSKEELLWKHTSFFSSWEHTKEFWQEMWETISSWKVWHWVIKNKNKQWDFIYLDTTITPIRNYKWEIIKYVVIRFDVTESEKLKENLEESNKKLEYMVYIDQLTKLPNLMQFQKDVETFWQKETVLIKINEFSKINWLYWYEAWNVLITKFTEKLGKVLQNYWLQLYRTWEMEYWILNTSWSKISRKTVFEDIFWWEVDYEISIQELNIKAVLNLSIWKATNQDSSSLYNNALIALYESKKLWKPVQYTPELEEKNRENIQNAFYWVNEIRNSLYEDRVVPAFQWIVDNRKWKITRYEALVRIQQDERLVSPWLFLPHAENAGFMPEITQVMIRKTIEAMKGNNFWFSINLTEEDIKNPEVFEQIKNYLQKYDINPERLSIEILEQVVSEDNAVLNMLNKYSQIGIKISIDDFWVGYSNISKFIRINPDYMKIDWSIVNWVHKDPEKQEIIKHIVNMWKQKWSKIVAEFIDTKEDQEYIKNLWIEYSQWFYFSKPTTTL